MYAHFFSEHLLVTSYSINLLFINEHQILESSLHTLLAVMSGKPPASFQVVKNNLCLKGMHTILIRTEAVYCEFGCLIVIRSEVGWKFGCGFLFHIHRRTPVSWLGHQPKGGGVSSPEITKYLRFFFLLLFSCFFLGGGGILYMKP